MRISLPPDSHSVIRTRSSLSMAAIWLLAFACLANLAGAADHEAQIASLRTLVDSGHHAEAKVEAANLKEQLATESKTDKEKLKQSTLKDDWENVTRLSRKLAVNKRQQDIVGFLAERVTDDTLTKADQAEAATIALDSYSLLTPNPISMFDHFEAAGFKLQRSSDPEETSDPALFGLTQDFETGSDTEFAADFFLSWSPYRMKGQGRRPGIVAGEEVLYEASGEGHLNSANDEAADAWKFRLTRNAIKDYGTEDSGPNTFQLHTNLSVKLEADRDFERQRLSGELEISPINLALAMGKFQPAKKWLIAGKKAEAEPPIQFRWLPTLSVDAGDIIDGPSKPEDSTVWIAGKLKAEVRLNFLKNLLDVDSVDLFAEGRSLYAADEGKWHSYLETGVDVMFNENVGWTLLYKLGETSPEFEDINLLTTGITVKF